MSFSSWRTAAAIAALAVTFPVLLRASVSPLVLLIASPFILVFSLLASVVFFVAVAHYTDAKANRSTCNNLQHAARPLVFSTPAAWEAVLTRSQWQHKSPQSLPPLYPEFPLVSSTINDILIMIVRDFVLVWYKDISSSPSFPTAVSESLHGSARELLNRANNIDLSALLVRRILPKITAHIDQFRQSEMNLRGIGLDRRLTQSDELDILLASRYVGSGGKLHPAVDNLSSMFTKQTEEAHLRRLVDKTLPYILPEADNNKTVRIVAREIVACAVMGPLTEMFSDPDFWNRTIDQLTGAAIQQQKLISKVRSILDAQSSNTRKRSADEITMRTDARHFESFLRSIGRCDSLLDARRLKSDIMGEIRRTRSTLANHENEEWIKGHRTEDVVAFLDRLYTAKREVEKRITVLGGQDDSRVTVVQEPGAAKQLTLRYILTSPSSLLYFMEFMDRRGRALLVQFWLTVESFKNPLETVDILSSEDDEDSLSGPSLSTTLKEDISMINDLYFSAPVIPHSLSAISTKYVNVIRDFVTNTVISTPAQERKVRRSVMLAQRQVEQDMDSDFEEFQRSDLWFRVVGDMESKTENPSPISPMASPPLQQKQLSSSGLFSSLVSNLTMDSNRTSQGAKPSTLFNRSLSTSALTEASKGAETQSLAPSDSSFASSAFVKRVVSGPQSSNLDFLMSSGSDNVPESRAPLFDDPEDKRYAEEAQKMEAIQAALTDIFADENKHAEHSTSLRVKDSHLNTEDTAESGTKSDSAPSVSSDTLDEADADGEGSLTTTSLVAREESEHGTFHLAAPGDLELSQEITRLGEKITKLQSQSIMLDALIRKAELTGDAQELRLLKKSKSAMGRETRQLIFQKTQYEQQESANKLVPGRTKVAIVNSTTRDEDGKSVVRYLIEIQQLAADGTFASGWVVARRYNEFFHMHQRLREKYLVVKNLDFPGKRLVTTLSTSFLDTRRVALEKYLQSILTIAIVCESDELRAFLSRESPFMTATLPEPSKDSAFPGQNLVRNVYRSFAESFDDMFFGPSMLDVMIGRLTRQVAGFAGIVGSGVTDEDLVTQALKASGKAAPEDTLLQLPGDLKPLDGETSTSSFSAPICDLILAVFELDKKNNWLRRQAIVIILQQVLGDTIERKLRSSIKLVLDEAHLINLINTFKEGLWPGGRLKTVSVPRTADEKDQTREEANRKLSAFLPDVAANMIGRSNARHGARRIFAVLQNRRLNQHIVYTVLDEVIAALFPDIKDLLNEST